MTPKRNQEDRLRAIRRLFHGEEPRPLPPLKADINVTPLVDVVLVLLIIFMVVTPMIASGVAVDLPRTVHHARKPDDGRDIIVSVTQDERFYVGTTRVNRAEDLAQAVNAERRKYPDKTVFLKADTRVPFGSVRAAMQALHDSDIQDIVLGTEELSKAE